MLLPIVIILGSNSVIMFKIRQFNLTKKKSAALNQDDTMAADEEELEEIDASLEVFYYIEKNKLKRVSNLKNNSTKITKLMIMISFAYALFNLPYTIGKKHLLFLFN